MSSAHERDPYAPLEASPRGATAAVVGALVCAVAAVLTGLAAVAGPLGMALGLLAHVKGHRWGFAATVLAAVGMVVGFTVTFLLR